MTTNGKHVRHGIGTVRAYIHGPLELPDFLKQTFEAVEIERHEFDPSSFHVEMQIGDSVIVIEAGVLPPDTPAWTNTLYVYVTDVDSVFERAVSLGAKAIAAPEDKPYQERQAAFRDSAGNLWWIATYTG